MTNKLKIILLVSLGTRKIRYFSYMLFDSFINNSYCHEIINYTHILNVMKLLIDQYDEYNY